MGVGMTARSIAEGQIVMAQLASIDAQLADITADEIDLLERRRKLLCERSVLFSSEAGTSQALDLRQSARRRRAPLAKAPVTGITTEDHERAERSLQRNEARRRSGT